MMMMMRVMLQVPTPQRSGEHRSGGVKLHSVMEEGKEYQKKIKITRNHWEISPRQGLSWLLQRLPALIGREERGGRREMRPHGALRTSTHTDWTLCLYIDGKKCFYTPCVTPGCQSITTKSLHV